MKGKFLASFMTFIVIVSSFFSYVSYGKGAVLNSKSNVVDFKKYFGDTEGCAVFYSVKNDRYDVYNPEMIDIREVPCSTFKIVSSLAGLKYGIIKDKNTLFKWDKTEQGIKEWEKDFNFESAFKASVNWYFDEVEKQVGTENMNKIIKEINYGNLKTVNEIPFKSSGIKISPREQLNFVRKLFNYELPFEKEHIDLLKEVMITDNEKGTLYGKTGTSGPFISDNGNQTGWFVGLYKTDEDEFYFALRIYGDKDDKNITGPYAKDIAKNICENVYF